MNQFSFLFSIFSGFLHPYVCWHCNTGCSSRAVTPSCFAKLRWPSSPKNSSHSDFVRSHLGRFRAHAFNQGVTEHQCKINFSRNFNFFPLGYSTFACISALFWSARSMVSCFFLYFWVTWSDVFKGRGGVGIRVIVKATMMKGNLLYSEPVESSDLGLLNWNCHCTWYFVFLCYLKPIIITQNQFKNKKKEWQINTDLKAKKLLKAVFCEWYLLHLMRKIKFQAFYFCCFCSHGTEHGSLWTVERKEWNKSFGAAHVVVVLFFLF